MIRVALDTDQPAGMRVTTGLLLTYADLADAALVTHLEQIHRQVVWIDRGLGDPLNLATIIDVETGTHRPADAPAWWDRRHAAGARYLTVYCDRDTLAELDREMGPRAHYRWVARLDGIAHVPGFIPGQTPALVQVLGAAALGFHADLSLVQQDAWHPAPAPQMGIAAAAAISKADTFIHDALAVLATVK